MPVDIDAAVKNALENRTDMVSARKNLERTDYNLDYAKSQLRPQLDLSPTTAARAPAAPRSATRQGNPMPTADPGG